MIVFRLTTYSDVIGDADAGYLVNEHEDFITEQIMFAEDDSDISLFNNLKRKGVLSADTAITDVNFCVWDNWIDIEQGLDCKPLARLEYVD